MALPATMRPDILRWPMSGWPADLPDGRALKNPVQYRQQKYSASQLGRNSFIDSNRPTPLQGRIAIVTDAGCGCGGRSSVLRVMGSQGGLAKGL
jgi:hypothetical protein